MEAPSNPALSSLQSEAQVELLDAIDKLRADGFSGELDLPQLIVCGKQSCGKSSVLEAISQVRFPAADTACTRFATELVLRKANSSSMDVKLIPAPNRKDMEQSIIAGFQTPKELIDAQNLEEIIKSAERHIDELDDNPEGECAFSQDRLQAIVYGPDLPPLTLVDLPGLIKTRERGTENLAVVEKIVKSYMSDESSIILAVITADDDIANQGILELARSYDPTGSRTLGIFTKPDKTEAGSPAEENAILCAQNEKYHLALGWHVLKNRQGHAHRNDTSEERDAAEEEFFRTSRWSAVPENSRGIKALRQRLSDVLFRSITSNLPALVASIQQKITTCEDNLQRLGKPKSTEQEQRVELTFISSDVQTTVKSSVDGYYDGKFFHGPTKSSATQNSAPVRQLRSHLRTILDEFSNRMQEQGQYYRFTRSANEPNVTASFSIVPSISNPQHQSVPISLEAAEVAAGEYIKANRGREPPGFPPSGAVAQIFRVQSSPWRAIAEDCIERCWLASQSFFVHVLEHFAAPHIAHAILQQLANAKLASIRANLHSKLEELLRPYKNGHPVTLDINRSLRDVGKSWSHGKPLSEDYVAWRALECQDTYYKIAVATFPETVATLAIENCLVEGLLEIFTPMTVANMDAEELCSLTAEPEHVATQRTFNQKRLSALGSIASVFSRYTHGSHGYQAYRPQTETVRHEEDAKFVTTFDQMLVIEKPDADESFIPNGNIDPLTPPKSPLSSRGPSSNATFEASASPSYDHVSALNGVKGNNTSPRRITPRRKANGAVRSLANHSPAPRVEQSSGTSNGAVRLTFAEDTSESEL